MSKVNICGIDHEIQECNDNFNVDTHFGQIDYKDCIIKINSDMPKHLKTATLCHEILHGMLVHIGRNDLTTDETFVTSLGNALAQTFNIKFID